jgi:Mrp family chromosome partitioning ATPase
MLRTQVLQEMDKNSWQFLAITSATAGCGKTVIACNLAVSISRLAERSVLLVDLDLHRPNVSKYLGLGADRGVVSALQGSAALSNLLVRATFSINNFLVLPGEVCKVGASELMASQAMATLLQTIKREFRSHIVIFDLPPMLMGDDVISILPQMESALLVAAAGETSSADILECTKHLKNTPVVRLVLNRVVGKPDNYYGYGY